MRVEIDSLNSNLAKFELTESQLNQIINDMEIKVNNFNYMYENEIIGCWFNESFTIGNTPLFIEINIFKGGVGALDFGGGVYQIFHGPLMEIKSPYILEMYLIQVLLG